MHERVVRCWSSVTRQILAVGGKQLDHPSLTEFVIRLTEKARPRVLFLPTASGDSPEYISRFYAAFDEAACEPQHLLMFVRPDDVETPIAEADVIVVGGGNTLNALHVWRLHGIDRALRVAYERGAVLTGWSAGCICWFADGITDSYGPTLRPLMDGLGWLAGSACPHYNGEEQRRPTYTTAVREGRIVPGYAVEDAVGLHFLDEQLVDIVTPRSDGRAFRVDTDGEHALTVRRISE